VKKSKRYLIAKFIGLFTIMYWIAPFIAWIFSGNKIDVSLEGTILTIIIAMILVGFIIAWFQKRIGGIVMVIGAIVLSVFAYLTAGHNRLLAVLVSGIPFLISGVLFLVS